MTAGSLTQRSRIADDLLRSIREQEYPVGTKLPSERQLAEQYGVSRPVVREALGMLSSLDVIEIQMGRGTFVTSADVHLEQTSEYGLLDIIDAREAIEAGAIKLAVARARRQERSAVEAALRSLEAAVSDGGETIELDLALHEAIVKAARAPVLLTLWAGMTKEIEQTIRVSPHGRSMSEAILAQHRELAVAVVTKDRVRGLETSEQLYAEHRRFLRALLG